MSPAPPTFEEVQEKRLSQLLNACIDMSLGSVWRVNEKKWMEVFRQQGQPYDWDSERKWHPGVSLRTAPLTSLHEYIPMLHGSSGDRGPVVVRGLTRDKAPDHPTSFGKIVRPAKVMVKDATSSANDGANEHLVGYMLDRNMVSANLDKPRLNETELEELRAWAQNRNLL
jgi:hypothetical protein